MSLKDKIIFILISIVTFGIYPIVIKKSINKSKGESLSIDKKITIDVDKIIENLGGKNNIVGSEYTQNKIKIFFNDKTLINVEGLNVIKGISGVVAGSKNVSLIVGKQAKLIADLI